MGLSLTVELFGYNVAILKIQDHVTPSFPYNTLKTSVYLWQYTRLSVTSEKAFVTVTFHAPFLRKLLESIYQPNKINKSGTGIQKTRDGDTVVKPGDKPHEASPQNGRETDEKRLPRLLRRAPKEKTLWSGVLWCPQDVLWRRRNGPRQCWLLIIVQLLLQIPRDSVHLVGEKEKFSFCWNKWGQEIAFTDFIGNFQHHRT